MKHNDTQPTYDVIIIGGGATGAGIARDCSYRGLKVLLLEKGDLANGATGRNHGLLHSGARYAVTDPESAIECIAENKILKQIASNCVEDHGGYFLSFAEDDPEFQKTFIEACTLAGIDTELTDPVKAINEEPSINPDITGAIKVPDGSIDPFRLTISNIIDAQSHGAVLKTYNKVTGLITDNGRVVGVKAVDLNTTQTNKFYADIVVNASGIWGHGIAEYAGLNIKMVPSKGALLIFGHRVNQMVLNRCRRPSDADILVPGDTITLIGTTSTNVPYDQIDNIRVTFDEVDLLLREGAKLAPALAYTRILRAYAGVRPLVASDHDPTGRSISRGIVLMDHAIRDGLEGFITITGGKLITYRLMAEKTTDLICAKLGVTAECTTHKIKLPESAKGHQARKRLISLPSVVASAAIHRHGALANEIFKDKTKYSGLVCECEEVTKAEVEYAIRNLNVRNMNDLRRRTRIGMGTCQGEMCACRAAAILGNENNLTPEQTNSEIAGFMDERWKGIRPVAWGEALREIEYSTWVYEHLCGLNNRSLGDHREQENP